MLFGTAKWNREDHLEIGGVDTVELAKKYGTPLFVYDVQHIREMARGFKQTFKEEGIKNKVVYASKAFSCLAVYKLLQEESLSCDVVSGGELYTAIKGGMDPKEIAFHGNNKTKSELQMAIDEGVGTIIVDNFYEIQLLSEILHAEKKTQEILFRVTPGISAETHDYILTGQVDSKFGFDVASGQAEVALQQLLADDVFIVKGVHCHIGSQIFSPEGFIAATDIIFDLLNTWKTAFNYTVSVFNIGGGFGIQYTDSDTPVSPAEFVKTIIHQVKENCQKRDYPLPEIWIEPGRSIVAEAGMTLYSVGSQKEVPGVRKFVSVDGGMGDNIRPALYDATYDALVANRQIDAAETTELISIVGKYCESGDVLIREIDFPKVTDADIIALTSTGAYGYSMASNYNRNPKPAVVFVENGQEKLVVRRETFDDLIHLDCPVD
ncbi:diaminopimelate decarboxylase [Enterococcus sp. JM4C]|uniref:diaminopimelate decarboxylase n=1 Tax=Candidatus Enterococcus huntleyi TaxID=1857217 RepID=UPI00137A8102|nr:diaminopimelate decarboxylase [Enterococcus sp. JM4C]KAF1296911.1 diaminopimelate decarboxylase [Enterococcus sp. JM4C]